MLDLLIFACTERPSAGSSGSGVTVTKITLNSNTTHRMEIEVSPPSRRESEAPDDDTLEVSSKILSEFLRFCVVRIRSSSQALDIWRPYSRGQPQSSVGTGFAVKLISGGYQQEDALANPIFITNAHVVNNAHAVLVSIPALSDEVFRPLCLISIMTLTLQLSSFLTRKGSKTILNKQNTPCIICLYVMFPCILVCRCWPWAFLWGCHLPK